ncbi:uncharacterized protein LOC143125423 [Alosa pseudoharengus]|uniref:uncharacterized protein LOC143125423 n=1 Tax=Alosa pseudoharengus TaxID=34774 RepID=UPI003F8C515A
MYLRVILSVIIFVFSEGLILQGPSRPLVAQLGGVLQLPCSVETPLPLDELEVEWRRTSSKELVHLFQGGEIRSESQSSAYTDRAYFFTKGDIAKGNYSLLLRNITTDDAGSYSCGVYTNEENSEIAVEIDAIERLVLTGTDHAVTAYVGQEVILNCFVDSHIPPEEVSWTKVESDKSQMLVLLFQDNVTYLDSAHSSYQGRTEFFNAEIPKGNFSLRLKDVRTEDKGEYMCQAHSGHLSANTTVVLEGLGLSSMHILILALCCAAVIVALVVSGLILVDIKDISQRALKMHYVLVFAPSILMFTAFVLWGVIEGFLGEVVTCSTVNLIRFILLFKTCLYQEKLPEMIKTIIKTGFVFEYFIIVSVLYFVIFFHVWSIERESKAMAFMGIMYGSSLHMGIRMFLVGGGAFMEIMDFFYLFTMSFLSRTFSESAFISMFAGVFVLILSNWILLAIVEKRYPFIQKSRLYWLGWQIFYFIRRLIISAVIFYFFNQILENHEERAGLMSVTALFHLLALSGIYDFVKLPLAETPKTILYKYGAVGLVVVNAATLATELILKSRTGERNVADLRVVVLPFECVFVLGWIVLWSHAYWMSNRDKIKTELDTCKKKGCRHWIKGLKGELDPSEDCEMTEMTNQPAAGASTQQGSPPEPPPETADADINVPDVPEDTNTCSSEPVNKEDSVSTDTATEAIEPNADTHRHTHRLTADEMDTSPVLQDKDTISNTNSHIPVTEDTDSLLSHGEKEPAETDFQEPRRNSVTEDMESSPLLQGDMVKSIPHSESN